MVDELRAVSADHRCPESSAEYEVDGTIALEVGLRVARSDVEDVVRPFQLSRAESSQRAGGDAHAEPFPMRASCGTAAERVEQQHLRTKLNVTNVTSLDQAERRDLQ